jgi:hypothetical protein
MLFNVALFAVLLIGLVATARWFDGLARPAPGWVCWQIARVTAEGTQRDRRCDLADGWHVERWPGGQQVAVPDQAEVLRRYPVRD